MIIIQESYAEAARYYQMAAENIRPDAEATWNLGYMHHFGIGNKRLRISKKTL